MSFTQFVKPYPDGYQDFESGGTPVTAAILNTNYDGFLLALNAWALQAETDIGSKADTNDVGNAFATVNGRIDSLEGTVSTKSTVTIRDLLSSGTKIGTIVINGTDYDLYAPSGGGGGSSVTWNQIVSTGTKIAEIEIDGVSTDVYVPSGSGTGGHTIIDENGNLMTARAGLQFVGGANVSDDATNNKTIVDLASAGGIDGVFVDIENVIIDTSYQGMTDTYTATEDCYVMADVVFTSSVAGTVKIDDKIICEYYYTNAGISVASYNGYLKKGQTLTIQHGYQSGHAFKVYGIQTGTTHSKFQPVIYSTEEREIGVWTDGKPLYEKTVDFGALPNNTTKDVAHNITNVDKIWVYDGFVYGNNNSFQTNRPTNAFTYQWETKADRTNVSIQDFADFSNDFSAFVVVRYTKTTDVAGSGSWTPQGVPAVHYSTDEHIVGKWIDGKSVYEKTFDLGSDLVVPYNSWVSLGITLDADKIIETKTTATVGSFQGNILMYNDNGTWKGTSPRNTDGSYVRYLTIQYTKSS